jgi:hypothetical protein
MVWVTADDIADALGPSCDRADPYLAVCANAAGAFAYRKRIEAGYDDDPVTVPGPDVYLGTVRAGVAFYSERGSVDSYASFDETAGFATTGAWPTIKRLLGIGRGRVDTPLDELPVVNPLTRRYAARRRRR